jgi:SAM-dependent methyltransferase
LAVFCRDAEFVFAVTPKEIEQLARLSPGRSAAQDLIARCYHTDEKEALSIAGIERLSPIADDTSLSVQAMYEDNPYPRWKQLPGAQTNNNETDTLIAGCGTGRHILMNAAASPRARFVGIDLSLASLAYGLGKAKEYGIGNVRLVHGDMLEVAKLGQTFDHISAVGSVHHMEDPVSGVKALGGVLKPEGTLKLAVYSKAGRASILAGIALRQSLGFPPTVDGIREFRQVICRLPPGHPAKPTMQFGDFYSISGARDLLFHVKEHNYTVAEIFDLIDASGLRLRNFSVPRQMQGADLTRESLIRLEQQHPGFAGPMFRFVLAL